MAPPFSEPTARGESAAPTHAKAAATFLASCRADRRRKVEPFCPWSHEAHELIGDASRGGWGSSPAPNGASRRSDTVPLPNIPDQRNRDPATHASTFIQLT